MKPTDPLEMLADLDGGVFANKLGTALSNVAAHVVDYSHGKKKGKVTVSFEFTQIGDSHQVQVEHTLAFSHPTLRGKATEEDTTSTPMHVSSNGLTLFPEAQADLFTKATERA